MIDGFPICASVINCYISLLMLSTRVMLCPMCSARFTLYSLIRSTALIEFVVLSSFDYVSWESYRECSLNPFSVDILVFLSDILFLYIYFFTICNYLAIVGEVLTDSNIKYVLMQVFRAGKT